MIKPYYQDEFSTIYNGNCLDILPEIKKVDYSFTSPPYNRKRNDKYKFYDDSKNGWFELNSFVIEKLIELSKNYVFYNLQSNYYNRIDFYNLIGLFSKKIQDMHIWEKLNPMPANGLSITNAIEYFLILGNESLKSNR